MSTVLAVDIGRTGCRVELWHDGGAAPVATATGEGSLGLGAERGVAVAEAAIIKVAKPLLQANHVDRVDAVGVGIPGVIAAPVLARQLAECLVESLPARATAVMSDAISSHAGALGGKPGVVLAIGTGAVTLAIGEDHRLHRVDGWGPWIGDEGSGAWFGRLGVQAAARARDGRGPDTLLASAAEQQFGELEPFTLKLGSDPNPARSLAAFAPAVAAIAREGDPVALRLMQDGATALAESMLAAARSIHAKGPVAATIIGGMVNMGPILMGPLHAVLARHRDCLQWQPAEGKSIDGARHLASADSDIHAAWVVRAGELHPPQ